MATSRKPAKRITASQTHAAVLKIGETVGTLHSAVGTLQTAVGTLQATVVQLANKRFDRVEKFTGFIQAC